jgi:hypothetical protein
MTVLSDGIEDGFGQASKRVLDCSASPTTAFSTKVDTGLVKENATNKGLERQPQIQIKWQAL